MYKMICASMVALFLIGNGFLYAETSPTKTAIEIAKKKKKKKHYSSAGLQTSSKKKGCGCGGK